MKRMVAFVLCFILGGTILTGCSGNNEPFMQKDYTVDGEQITGISIDVRDRQIEVALSTDSQIHIDYSESSKEYYNISTSDDGVLTMSIAEDKQWTDYIGVKSAASNRKILLQVPNELLTSLHISTTNEDISLPSLTVLNDISISVNGGNISFELLNAGKSITLNSKNGDIQGNIMGSYEDYSINCNIKKGESTLPSIKDGGTKQLSVVANNGTVDIDFHN